VRELVRTNDPVLISVITALLEGVRITHSVLDQNMSVLEGSLGILPRRILVDDERYDEACRLLKDAGLANEIKFGTGKPTSGND
jgi:Putative prokaryotic signal transducing protein